MKLKEMTLFEAIQNGLGATAFDTLRGEFTEVAPSSKLASPTSTNPISKAHFAMIRELARMHIPTVDGSPEGFEDCADYIRRVTALFDVTWLQAVGTEIESNASNTVDLNMFCGQFVGAIDGNATHELDCCADAARDAQDEGADADYRWDEMREHR